ncbi:MAG: CBS domain-containing protein [bacterium]|nr:CBS domain-containing protein [bacterium]
MSIRDFPAYTLADLPTSRLRGEEFRTVRKSDSVKRALTIMVVEGISQVPVLKDMHTVAGVVTWRSLACHGNRSGRIPDDPSSHGTAGDALEPLPGGRTFPLDTPVIEILDLVFWHDFVLTHDDEMKPCGIVTASDVTRCATAFLAVGEIERHLLTALSSVSDEAIDRALCHGDSGESTNAVPAADPRDPRSWSFGDCGRLFDDDAAWELLPDGGLWQRIDRTEFRRRLKEANAARNRAFHFRYCSQNSPRPDEGPASDSDSPTRDSDADLLAKFARCLRIIAGLARRDYY